MIHSQHAQKNMTFREGGGAGAVRVLDPDLFQSAQVRDDFEPEFARISTHTNLSLSQPSFDLDSAS